MRGTLMRSTQNPSYFSSKDILSSASGDGCGSGNFLCITYGSFCNRGNYSEKFKVMTTLVKAIPFKYKVFIIMKLTVVVVTMRVLLASFSTLCPTISLAVNV